MSFFREVKALFALSGPILAAQIAQTMMGFIDTLMAGNVSAVDLAAVALATSLWLPALLLVVGVIMALTPLVSRHHGAGQTQHIAFEMQQSLWLGLVSMVLVVIAATQTARIFELMDADPIMRQKATQYLDFVIWGAPAIVLYQVMRNVSEGMSHTMPSMLIGVLGLMCNIPANYAFIYGHWGAPQLGGAGCGVATALVQWAMALAMLGYLLNSRRFAFLKLFNNFYRPQWQRLWYHLRLGLPMALALFFEVTLFAVVAVLLAPLGPKVVASHQIAISFSSIIFMLPLSMSFALTVRVAHALGKGHGVQAFYSIKVVIISGLSLTLFTALGTFLFRYPIIRIYNDQPEVVELAAQLMLFCVFYQISDMLQVIGSGALRGLNDSRAIFIITLVAYWCIGLPIGYTLALTDYWVSAMGAPGFWIGFLCGLSSAALFYVLRLYYLHGQVLRFPERFIGNN